MCLSDWHCGTTHALPQRKMKRVSSHSTTAGLFMCPAMWNFRCKIARFAFYSCENTVVTASFTSSNTSKFTLWWLLDKKVVLVVVDCVYAISPHPNKYIIDRWLELIIDVMAKKSNLYSKSWMTKSLAQINQIHIKWPGGESATKRLRKLM